MRLGLTPCIAWLVIVWISQAIGAGIDRNSVDVGVIDANTKASLQDAFVTGRQFYYTPGGFHHSPVPVCFREENGISDQHGAAQLQLPKRPLLPLTEVLVYRPGYCAARREVPSASSPVQSPRSVRIELSRSEDAIERRLRYLIELSGRWRASCGAGDSRESSAIKAMLAEMDEIKRTEYDKFLVDRVRFELDPSRARPFIPPQIVRVQSDAEVTFTERGANITVKAPPIGLPPRTVQYVLRCRSGKDGCDINARDEGGRTELMKAAVKPDLEFMRDLLAQGADPSIEVEPGRDTVLDQVVRSTLYSLNSPDKNKLNGYLDAIRMLGQTSKVSISQEVDSYVNGPTNQSPDTLDAMAKLRAGLSVIPVRPKATFSCIGLARN